MPLRAPTLDEVRQARDRIAGTAMRTPLVRFDPVGTPSREVFLKLECLQPIGAFKIRGAANAMALAGPDSLRDGVWTASAGNMAQGVAWCAREGGVACRVVVPDHAPRAKTDAIERLGASVVRVPFDAWWQAMIEHRHPGMDGLMIHPFADTAVMAGNGTIGLEIADDLRDVDAVLVPWGGGGLACGIAAALREVSPGTKVYAVEVETAAPLTASIAAGKPVTVTRTRTFIDGMGSDRVSEETWPLVAGLIVGTVVVTVAQVAAAVKRIAERTHVIAEGGGAAPLAAALGGRLNGREGATLEARRVVGIVSGGNIDADVLSTLFQGEVPS